MECNYAFVNKVAQEEEVEKHHNEAKTSGKAKESELKDGVEKELVTEKTEVEGEKVKAEVSGKEIKVEESMETKKEKKKKEKESKKKGETGEGHEDLDGIKLGDVKEKKKKDKKKPKLTDPNSLKLKLEKINSKMESLLVKKTEILNELKVAEEAPSTGN